LQEESLSHIEKNNRKNTFSYDPGIGKEGTEMIEETTRKWISLGDRQFYIEDIESIFIQANHLIINFDYTDKQLVIFFGRSNKSYENARKVFDILGEMFNAYKIDLPEDAIPSPDIMKTVYGEKISKEIQSQVRYEKDKFKKRHKRKLDKALAEIKYLKSKVEK
jgi:hypothetical protein